MIKYLNFSDKTQINQKSPLISDNPVLNFSKVLHFDFKINPLHSDVESHSISECKWFNIFNNRIIQLIFFVLQNKVGSDGIGSDNDIIFVSESKVTEKEISAARHLMLPDKFYSYKDLPPCPGCRGCDNDLEIIENDTSKIPTSVVSFENKPTSGVFNFENFTLSTAPTGYSFGGNARVSTIAPITQNIFGNPPASVFGSESIFGSKSQSIFNPANTGTAPSFTDGAQNEKYFETINKPFTKGSVFGSNVQLGANNQAVTTTQSSGLLEKLLASSGAQENHKNNGESDQNKSASFWTVKTPFSFGNVDNKSTVYCNYWIFFFVM